MFKTKDVIVSPNFDSDVYKGTFNIVDAESNQYNFRYPSKLTKKDFDALSLIILTVVDTYVKAKDKKKERVKMTKKLTITEKDFGTLLAEDFGVLRKLVKECAKLTITYRIMIINFPDYTYKQKILVVLKSIIRQCNIMINRIEQFDGT